jgi:hypothetical protein
MMATMRNLSRAGGPASITSISEAIFSTQHTVVPIQIGETSLVCRVLRSQKQRGPLKTFFSRQPQTPAAWFPIVVEWGPGTHRGLESARVDYTIRV